MAAIGARIAMAMTPTMFPPSSSFPPKMRDHWAMLATKVITPAMVAATELMRVSLFLTWDSSWAITASSSSLSRILMIPVVAATAAWEGFLPVAKALGMGVSTM